MVRGQRVRLQSLPQRLEQRRRGREAAGHGRRRELGGEQRGEREQRGRDRRRGAVAAVAQQREQPRQQVPPRRARLQRRRLRLQQQQHGLPQRRVARGLGRVDGVEEQVAEGGGVLGGGRGRVLEQAVRQPEERHAHGGWLGSAEPPQRRQKHVLLQQRAERKARAAARGRGAADGERGIRRRRRGHEVARSLQSRAHAPRVRLGRLRVRVLVGHARRRRREGGLAERAHEVLLAEGERLRVFAVAGEGARERGTRRAAHVGLRVKAAAQPGRDELLEVRRELPAELLRKDVEHRACLLADLPRAVVGKPAEGDDPVRQQRDRPVGAVRLERLAQLRERLSLGDRVTLAELLDQQRSLRIHAIAAAED